jgi:hypothetical protein
MTYRHQRAASGVGRVGRVGHVASGFSRTSASIRAWPVLVRAASARLAVGVVLALCPSAVLANGQQFFTPGANDKVDLAYFGRVKDARTGRPIAVPPQLTVIDRPTTLYIPFDGDRPGHFSSPDVGLALKDLTAGQDVDVKALEIQVGAPGYKTVSIKKVPRKTSGRVELDVYLEPDPAAASTTAAPPDPRRNWSMRFTLLAGMSLVALATAARRRGRRTLRT